MAETVWEFVLIKSHKDTFIGACDESGKSKFAVSFEAEGRHEFGVAYCT